MAKTGYFKYALLCVVLSGLLLSLVFPFWACEFSQIGKTGLGCLAWVALVPIMLFVLNARRMRHVVLAGLFTGTVNHFLLLYWLMGTMHNYGDMSWPLSAGLLLALAVITSVFMILTVVLTRFCIRSPWLFFFGSACVWVAVEYLRTYAFTGLPWALFGYTQFQRLELIQIADVTGVYGISFLLVLANAAIALLLNALNQHYVERGRYLFKSFVCLIIAIAVIAGTFFYGTARESRIKQKLTAAAQIDVGLVQASISQHEKWAPKFQNATMQAYAELTLQAAESRPDIIIWSETALPFYFPQTEDLSQKVFALVNYIKIPLFTGAPRYEIPPGETDVGRFKYYNSAFLVMPEHGLQDIYDKVHLVPFGEYVPWQSVMFFMNSITGGSFERGEAGKLVHSPLLLRDRLKIGTLICYEGIFPDLARAHARNGANLLVNITNDAWYDYSAGPYQHFIISMFRSIETRTAFVRCANTGISAYVMPTGEIAYQTQLFEKTGTVYSVPLMSETTFYTRNSDLFARAVSVLAIIFVLSGMLSRRRTKFYMRELL